MLLFLQAGAHRENLSDLRAEYRSNKLNWYTYTLYMYIGIFADVISGD